MSKKIAKRFYKEVSTQKVEGGYAVMLDTRQLKTPGRHALILAEDIAKLVASEWDAQVEEIKPDTMPVTRLLNVAIERTPEHRDTVIDEARKYAGTDLLCYRSEDRPLFERQTAKWDPMLDWANETFDIKLKTCIGIMHIEQDAEALDKVARYAATKNDTQLTLLVHFTAVFGSAILAMAAMEKHIPAMMALELSRLDEIFQIERWGLDYEAEDRIAILESETKALSALI